MSAFYNLPIDLLVAVLAAVESTADLQNVRSTSRYVDSCARIIHDEVTDVGQINVSSLNDKVLAYFPGKRCKKMSVHMESPVCITAVLDNEDGLVDSIECLRVTYDNACPAVLDRTLSQLRVRIIRVVSLSHYYTYASCLSLIIIRVSLYRSSGSGPRYVVQTYRSILGSFPRE